MNAARKHLEQAIEINPEYAEAYYKLGLLLKKEDQTDDRQGLGTDGVGLFDKTAFADSAAPIEGLNRENGQVRGQVEEAGGLFIGAVEAVSELFEYRGLWRRWRGRWRRRSDEVEKGLKALGQPSEVEVFAQAPGDGGQAAQEYHAGSIELADLAQLGSQGWVGMGCDESADIGGQSADGL